MNNMNKAYEPAVFTHDLSGTNSLDPKGALNIALTNSRRKSVARQVFAMWPNLRAASEKLAGLVTAIHPSPEGGYILTETIRRAFDAFKPGLGEGSGKDIDRACEFMTILLASADDIVRYKLYGRIDNNNCVIWEPFSEPIGEWVKQHGVLELAWEEVPNKSIPDIYQWILAGKILSYMDSEMVMSYKNRPKRVIPQLRLVK